MPKIATTESGERLVKQLVVRLTEKAHDGYTDLCHKLGQTPSDRIREQVDADLSAWSIHEKMEE